MVTAKAWVAFAGTVVTALTAALSDDVFNANDVQEVVIALVPAIGTLYATWKVPNKKSE